MCVQTILRTTVAYRKLNKYIDSFGATGFFSERTPNFLRHF